MHLLHKLKLPLLVVKIMALVWLHNLLGFHLGRLGISH